MIRRDKRTRQLILTIRWCNFLDYQRIGSTDCVGTDIKCAAPRISYKEPVSRWILNDTSVKV